LESAFFTNIEGKNHSTDYETLRTNISFSEELSHLSPNVLLVPPNVVKLNESFGQKMTEKLEPLKSLQEELEDAYKDNQEIIKRGKMSLGMKTILKGPLGADYQTFRGLNMEILPLLKKPTREVVIQEDHVNRQSSSANSRIGHMENGSNSVNPINNNEISEVKVDEQNEEEESDLKGPFQTAFKLSGKKRRKREEGELDGSSRSGLGTNKLKKKRSLSSNSNESESGESHLPDELNGCDPILGFNL